MKHGVITPRRCRWARDFWCNSIQTCAPKARQIRFYSSAEAMAQGTILQSIEYLSDCSSSDYSLKLQAGFSCFLSQMRIRGVMTKVISANIFLSCHEHRFQQQHHCDQLVSQPLASFIATVRAIGKPIPSNASAEFRRDFLIDATVVQRQSIITSHHLFHQ